MSNKDDEHGSRVGGFDANGVWHDPGDGQFAKPGWSTAKSVALGLFDLVENLAKERGDAGLEVHPKGDSLKGLGVGPGDAVRAKYLDDKHALIEIVRDGKLIQRKVAWNTLDRPVTTPSVDTPNVPDPQAADFASRLLARVDGDPASDAELLATAKAMFEHDLGDGYKSTVASIGFTPRGPIYVSGDIVSPRGGSIGKFSRGIATNNKADANGFVGVEVGHGTLNIDTKHQGKGLGTQFVGQSIDAYRAAGIDRVSTSAVSDQSHNGAYTWAKTGFDWDGRADQSFRVRGIGEMMLAADPESDIGRRLTAWEDDGPVPNGMPTPLEVALDPVGAEVLKDNVWWNGVLNLSEAAQAGSDSNVADGVPTDIPDPLADRIADGEVSYVRVGDIADKWTHEEGPLSRKLAESRVSEFGQPPLYDQIHAAQNVHTPIIADSLWNDGATSRDPLTPQDTHVLVNGHHRVAVLNDINPDAMIPVRWRGGPSANPYLSEEDRKRLGDAFHRREIAAARGETLPTPTPAPAIDTPPAGHLTGDALDAAVADSLSRTGPEYRDWATADVMAQYADDVRGGAVVNVPHTVLPSIIADGRVKSTHEVGGELTADRAAYEEKFMGIPLDTPAAQRPVYGTTAARIGDGADYGDIVLFVRPDRGDVSFTAGDSLTFNAVPILPDDVPGASEDRLMAAAGEEGGYLETQILGGLPLADITQVAVPDTAPDGTTKPDYRKMFDDAGYPDIKIVEYKARYAPGGTLPVSSDFSTLGAAPAVPFPLAPEMSPELAAVVDMLNGDDPDGFDREDELVMDLGMALFSHEFGDGKYESQFETGMVSGFDGAVHFDGIIVEPDTGTIVGSFSRQLSVDEDTGAVEMYHDLFRVNDEFQGRGIGSQFTAATLDAYRTAGIDQVRTTAASGSSYNDDGTERPGMRMNGGYTWAAAGFDWDPEIGHNDGSAIGRRMLQLDPQSEIGRKLAEWLDNGPVPDDMPTPFDVAADPIGKRVLLGEMGNEQLDSLAWMAVLPLTGRAGSAPRGPVTEAGRNKRDGIDVPAPDVPSPGPVDVPAPDVPDTKSTVKERIQQGSLFAEDFGFTGKATPNLFDGTGTPTEPVTPEPPGPLVVADLAGLGDALDRVDVKKTRNRYTATLDAEDTATVKRFVTPLFSHRGPYANSTVESVRPTALADGTPAFIVDGLITSESGVPIGFWQRQIAADRSGVPPVWAVRGTSLRITDDYRGNGYGLWFVASSEDALRDAGFDHVITDAVSDPDRDLNGAYTMATAGYDWDTSPEAVAMVRALGQMLLDEDPESWIGEDLASWDGEIRDGMPTPLDVALDPDGAELLRYGQAAWIGKRTLNDPNRTDLPPLDDPTPEALAAMSTADLFGESAPFRSFSPAVQDRITAAAGQWYEHLLSDEGHHSKVVGVSFSHNSAGAAPVTIDGTINDPDGNIIGRFTRAIHRVDSDDLSEPTADGDTFVIDHEYLSIDATQQGKGLGSKFLGSSLDWYQGHGFDTVTTQATSDGDMNGGYTWAVAGFDWDPAHWDSANNIGQQMLELDPQSEVGLALAADNMSDDSPTPLDVAMDPVGKLVLTGKSGPVAWEGVLPISPDAPRREPVTDPARERAGLDPVAVPEPAVPNTNIDVDGSVPFDPNEPIPVSPRVGARLGVLGNSGYNNTEADAEATAIGKAMFDHDLGDGYKSRVINGVSSGDVDSQGTVVVAGEIVGPDGTVVGKFSRQFKPMVFGANHDGADRVPHTELRPVPQVSPIPGMELGETKTFPIGDLSPETLDAMLPGTTVTMTDGSGNELVGIVGAYKQVTFPGRNALGSVWTDRIGEFATASPGETRMRGSWSDGNVTITQPDMIPDERVTVWDVTPAPDVGLGVYNDILKLDSDHQGKGIGSRFIAASEERYREIGVDQTVVHAVTRNYPNDPKDQAFNGAYTWAKAGGYDFIGDRDGRESVQLLGNSMLKIDPESQMGKVLAGWTGGDRENLPTPLEVALDPVGAQVLKTGEYSQWWGVKPISDRFKAMQLAQRERSLTDGPVPAVTNDDETVGGDVPFDLDQPIPLTPRVMARLAHMSENGVKEHNDPELMAIARAIYDREDIGDGVSVKISATYSLNGKGDRLDVFGSLIDANGARIGTFERRFRPMAAGQLVTTEYVGEWVETPVDQVSPIPGVGLGESGQVRLADLPDATDLPTGLTLTWEKTNSRYASENGPMTAVYEGHGQFAVTRGPNDVQDRSEYVGTFKLEEIRGLDRARVGAPDDVTVSVPVELAPHRELIHNPVDYPNHGYGVQNYIIEIADAHQGKGIGSRFIAASEESYAKVGFDQTVVHAVGDGERFNGAYTWAKAGGYDWMHNPRGFGNSMLALDPDSEMGKRLAGFDGEDWSNVPTPLEVALDPVGKQVLLDGNVEWWGTKALSDRFKTIAEERRAGTPASLPDTIPDEPPPGYGRWNVGELIDPEEISQLPNGTEFSVGFDRYVAAGGDTYTNDGQTLTGDRLRGFIGTEQAYIESLPNPSDQVPNTPAAPDSGSTDLPTPPEPATPVDLNPPTSTPAERFAALQQHHEALRAATEANLTDYQNDRMANTVPLLNTSHLVVDQFAQDIGTAHGDGWATTFRGSFDTYNTGKITISGDFVDPGHPRRVRKGDYLATIYPNGTMAIDHVDITPRNQGQGIGTGFVRQLIDNARAAGVKRVTLTGTEYDDMYGVTTWAKLGFQIQGGVHDNPSFNRHEAQAISDALGKPLDEITSADVIAHPDLFTGKSLYAKMSLDLATQDLNAPTVREPDVPATPDVPAGRVFAGERPTQVFNNAYTDGTVVPDRRLLPAGAGREYTITDGSGAKFRLFGKSDKTLTYKAIDDPGGAVMTFMSDRGPFTISDVVPGKFDDVAPGADAAVVKLGDAVIAANPDIAPVVWSDASPAAWFSDDVQQRVRAMALVDETPMDALSALVRWKGAAQKEAGDVGAADTSEREILPDRFYKVESATIGVYPDDVVQSTLWTTTPPTPDAPAYQLTRGQISAAQGTVDGHPAFAWTQNIVDPPQWDAPEPENPRTTERRTAAIQEMATNLFPVDTPIWQNPDRETLSPKAALIDALTRGGYAEPRNPVWQRPGTPVRGVVIAADGSAQWSAHAPGEGDLAATALETTDTAYSIDDPMLPQALAAAAQRKFATQFSQTLNGRQQRSGRGRTVATPGGDYAIMIDNQSNQIMADSFSDTTDLAYDPQTGSFTVSPTPTDYHVTPEQLRRGWADKTSDGTPRLWLPADVRSELVGMEVDYTKVRDKSLPFDDRVSALAEQRTVLQRMLPGGGPRGWFTGSASDQAITAVIAGNASEEVQQNMQRVAMLQEFGAEIHALVAEQLEAGRRDAHTVPQEDTDRVTAAMFQGVFGREMRSQAGSFALSQRPATVLTHFIQQMDGNPDMVDDPFVLTDVSADGDAPTGAPFRATLTRLGSRETLTMGIGENARGESLFTIRSEAPATPTQVFGPITLHTDEHKADLANLFDTLKPLNHISKPTDAIAETTAANRGRRATSVAKVFPEEATREAGRALLENTAIARFGRYDFEAGSDGQLKIDGYDASMASISAGTKDGQKYVKLSFLTERNTSYERKFTVTINDDNSMLLHRNGIRRPVSRVYASEGYGYDAMVAALPSLKRQAPKADKKPTTPTMDAATLTESTPLKAFHDIMEKMGVDMSTDESLRIGNGGEGPLKPIGEATPALAETARAGLAVYPRAWTTVLAKNRPIRLQLRRGSVDFRSDGGFNQRGQGGQPDLISTPDITLRPDYADVAGHEFGHSFQHVIPGLEAAEQWYLVSRVAASPPDKQKPRVYGRRSRRGSTDYVYEDEFARSYTGRTYGGGVTQAREVFTTAVQGMYNTNGEQSGFGADPRLQSWAIAMMALHDPGVGDSPRASLTGAQLLGASYTKKDVEALLRSGELTVAQRAELNDILKSFGG